MAEASADNVLPETACIMSATAGSKTVETIIMLLRLAVVFYLKVRF